MDNGSRMISRTIHRVRILDIIQTRAVDLRVTSQRIRIESGQCIHQLLPETRVRISSATEICRVVLVSM